jgi:membrane protease YdiL (CAAX protease family)
LGAWIGVRWSSVVVAFLFMAAHIPNYTSGAFHLSLPVALLAALAHAGIGVLILFGVWKSQDIIVFGVLHWFINRVSDFTTI